MNIIFGPIYSRRFGKSLGIDLSPNKKQCNFDCLYCELDSAKTIDKYRDIISVKDIITALKISLIKYQDINVITLTANGEPTLYPYMRELIDQIYKIKGDIKTLILSNSSTINDIRVQDVLLKLDEIKLSLDCGTQKCLEKLDRSHKNINIIDIKAGILAFNKRYKNSLIIEILIVKRLNDSKEEIQKLNDFLLELKPTRIDLGTIDRPPAFNVQPLNYCELIDISLIFDASLPIYIVSRKKADIKSSSYSNKEILYTLSKRPLTPEDTQALFDKNSKQRLQRLLKTKKIKSIVINNVEFYKKI